MTTNRKLVAAAIISASLAVMLSSGIRSSFGLFLAPITETLGTGRENLSIAIAINNIVFGLPLIGLLSDRFGPRRVMIAGAIFYSAGLVLVALVKTTLGLMLSLGLLVGIALSATHFVIVLGAVAQLVSEDQRSRVFGIITAMSSAGMFVVPPLAQLLVSSLGWQGALYALAAVAAVVALMAFGLPSRPGTQVHGVQQPHLWYRLDIEAIGQTLPYQLMPVVLQLGPADGNALNSRRAQGETYQSALPHRIEQDVTLDEGNHFSYALQWFGFAITAAVVYISVARRSENRPQ